MFRMKRLKCGMGVDCQNPDNHSGYSLKRHVFNQSMFERLTGYKWERGYRMFRLVEVRPKRGSKRG